MSNQGFSEQNKIDLESRRGHGVKPGQFGHRIDAPANTSIDLGVDTPTFTDHTWELATRCTDIDASLADRVAWDRHLAEHPGDPEATRAVDQAVSRVRQWDWTAKTHGLTEEGQAGRAQADQNLDKAMGDYLASASQLSDPRAAGPRRVAFVALGTIYDDESFAFCTEAEREAEAAKLLVYLDERASGDTEAAGYARAMVENKRAAVEMQLELTDPGDDPLHAMTEEYDPYGDHYEQREVLKTALDRESFWAGQQWERRVNLLDKERTIVV